MDKRSNNQDPVDSSIRVVEKESIESLFKELLNHGFTLIGPTIKENAIVYDKIESIKELPEGFSDLQEKNSYRLFKTNSQSLFSYNSSPFSWKKFFFPPRLKLWESYKNNRSVSFSGQETDIPMYAFIGVHACDINAILIQDKVFNSEQYRDLYYYKARERSFIIAVNCTRSVSTCFCASMNTGPKVRDGFDIALTEVNDGVNHYFLAEAGSRKGEELIGKIPNRKAADSEVAAASELTAKAAEDQFRTLDTAGIKELLYRNFDSKQWDSVAGRCLTCANCTLVCPTCFCNTTEDITDLSGEHAERWRRWDSCFNLDFARVAGGNFRYSPKARYRQWLTHKLASWIDQFGVSGCVGCGRCITWCPVGIDLTEETEYFKNNTKELQK